LTRASRRSLLTWAAWTLAASASASGGDLADRLVEAPSADARQALASSAAAELTPALVDAMIARCEDLRQRGRFRTALPALEFARDLALRMGDDEGFAEAWNAIGSVHAAVGAAERGRAAHREALAVCERIGSPACSAAAYAGLARIARNRDVVERTALAARAASAADAAGDPRLVAAAAIEVGGALEQGGDYARAEERYRRALEIAQRSRDEAREASAYTAIGRVHRLRGEIDAALELHMLALEIVRRLGHRDAEQGTANNIGICHSLRSDFTAAMAWFQKALDLASELENHDSIGNALNNVGIVHRRQGNLDLALEYFNRALTTREALGDVTGMAASLNNLGLTQANLERHQEAIATFERALALAEQAGLKNETANVISNIGVNRRAMREYAPALAAYGRGLELRRELKDRAGEGNVLRSIANVHADQGEHALALESARKAVALARETGLRDVLVDGLAITGASYLAQGDLARAQEALSESIALVEVMRAQVSGGEEPQQRFFEILLSSYLTMVDLKVAQGDVAAGLAYAERAKGRVLLDVLRGGRTNVFKDMTDAERAEERALRQRTVDLVGQLGRERRSTQAAPAEIDRLEDELAKARLANADFESRLYAAHPRLKVDRGQAQDFAPSELERLLPDRRTALVEYVVGERSVRLFVATREVGGPANVRVYDLPLDRASVRTTVRKLRAAVTGRELGVRDGARLAYDALLRPAAAQLAGRTRWVIVPDDALWDLPFQALVTPSGRYLVEDVAVSYVPSLTVLREVVSRRAATKADRPAARALLALGNPSFAGAAPPPERLALRSSGLVPLPEAEREVRTLGRLYGASASTVLVGAEAREDVLKRQAGGFRVLHLATHGELDAAAPLRSHVLLTPGSAEEDGVLEAGEIMNLPLKAELVVLSACETGRGRITGGEGLIGLSWALFVAGTPTSVVSQWKIDSTSTSEFMVALHRHLRASPRAAKAQALRAASRALLAKPAYRHPFYWAGFVMMGDAS
jgi:CHAT domain-containing protein/tetratricopeptide (TPR) repeat protein